MQPATTKFLLIAAILLSQTLLAANSEAEKNHSINGPVKSYFTREYDVQNEDGTWVKGKHAYSPSYNITHFDKEGRSVGFESVMDSNNEYSMIMKVVATYDGDTKREFTYDEKGSLIGESTLTPISDNEWSYTISMPNDGEVHGKKTITKTDSTSTTVTTGYKGSETYTYTTTSKTWIDGDYEYSCSVFDNGPDSPKVNLLAKIDTKTLLVVEQSVAYSNSYTDYRRFVYTKFDKYNSWIERIAFTSKQSKEPSYIEVRKIEYY